MGGKGSSSSLRFYLNLPQYPVGFGGCLMYIGLIVGGPILRARRHPFVRRYPGPIVPGTRAFLVTKSVEHAMVLWRLLVVWAGVAA